MKYTVDRVGIVSAMKIYFMIGLVIGLIYGAGFFLLFLIGGLGAMSFGGEDAVGGGLLAIVIGFFLAALIVVGFAIIQAIAGGIGAIVYNLIARTVGGLEITLGQKK